MVTELAGWAFGVAVAVAFLIYNWLMGRAYDRRCAEIAELERERDGWRASAWTYVEELVSDTKKTVVFKR